MSDGPALDPAVQHPTKLAVVAFLSGCVEADFKTVRDRLELTDSALSRTLSGLEETGHVAVRKGFVGKRPRTWVSLTAEGRRRLAGHLTALQRIAAGALAQAADLPTEVP
ncbi:DNA-binding MarR family transcriptional regulator [Kineococcus radiotolerans]|uniref:DNA-binding MarR family transcriptional regulator n=1 Tax=Kineococcus radiotolerans TaxID=131568 RepID=A0A7W4TPV8_KINRA|nr:transcriptional regulator [Kineococcus radiotolerans]MBB2902487.1 DNA-binding MarR family transcriptional regulator [Kineococcus radiotolerans]